MFQNVATQNSDVRESPKRKNTTVTTERKFEFKNNGLKFYFNLLFIFVFLFVYSMFCILLYIISPFDLAVHFQF